MQTALAYRINRENLLTIISLNNGNSPRIEEPPTYFVYKFGDRSDVFTEEEFKNRFTVVTTMSEAEGRYCIYEPTHR